MHCLLTHCELTTSENLDVVPKKTCSQHFVFCCLFFVCKMFCLKKNIEPTPNLPQAVKETEECYRPHETEGADSCHDVVYPPRQQRKNPCSIL